MNFKVKYYFPMTQDIPLKVCGNGMLQVHETGIIVQGSALPFYFSGITWPLQPIIAQPYFISIPYARIVEHRGSRWWSRGHHLHFLNPAGERCAIGFVFASPRSSNGKSFSELLSRCLEQCKTLGT